MARAGSMVAMVVAGATLSSWAAAASISWAGAADCRRELEVVEQIEAATGRRLSEVDDADFELSLETVGHELRLLLTTRGRKNRQPATRVIQGKSCVEVTDAAAVAIALAIGSEPETVHAVPAPLSPARGPMAARVAVPRASTVAPGAAASQERPTFAAAARVTLDSAATPEPVPGGSLSLSLAVLSLRAELEGALYSPGDAQQGDGQGGTFQLTHGATLLCGLKRWRKPFGLVCAGYELGQLSGEGRGVSEPHLRRTLWHGPRAELGFGWPLSNDWSLMARLGGVLPLSRPVFVLDSPRVVHRAKAFSVRAGLGIELTL